jgi:hypothetical protein
MCRLACQAVLGKIDPLDLIAGGGTAMEESQ